MVSNQAASRAIGRRKKAPKGTVKVESDKGWLRLRFTHLGQRHAFAIGLVDSQVNRTVAEQRAKQIELDILSGNFDTTLKKYKPESHKHSPSDTQQPIACGELFHRYREYKAKRLYARSLEKYDATTKYLRTHFGETNADSIDEDAVEGFIEFLKTQGNGDQVLKERLSLLSACWEWSLEKGLIGKKNPWKKIKKQIRVAPKQSPKPFTREEIKVILETFRKHPQYSHYLDYVQFLFSTGVRTAEAIGLKWKHISDDFSTIWIGETLSRKVEKATKTYRDRTFPMNAKLQALLRNRKPENCDPNDLVFTSPKGLPIDDHNFRNRAWVKTLEKAGVAYRKPGYQLKVGKKALRMAYQ